MRCQILLAAAFCLSLPAAPAAQGVTGALIGTVKDAQGGVLAGASVRVSSPARIGGPAIMTTDDHGQLRFPALTPGVYVLDIELEGFTPVSQPDIHIGAGATIERTVVLEMADFAQSVVVEGAGSRIEARGSGLETRVGPEHIGTIPTRRASMFDLLKGAPGISPTTQAATALLSVFGSGSNENLFHIDGTNFTSVANGVARTEPGVDFIQEVQVQSVGASAEYGNVQGAVINIVTRQGGNSLLYDASYYLQADALTGQPVHLPCGGCEQAQSGYERERYRDFSTTFGGPIARDRLWFFTGYQYLRDHDSQPGSDRRHPRTYEQDKVFAKLTWRLAPGWQMVNSVYDEFWVNTETPTSTKRFDATQRVDAHAPAITIAHLTHASTRTVWDVRVGRLLFSQESSPGDGGDPRPSRSDSVTSVISGGPPQLGGSSQARTTFKATVSRYTPDWFGADHDWKVGAQFEDGGHRSQVIIPTGVRYIDNNSAPARSESAAPSNAGGRYTTAAVFISDTLTPGDRVTINAGLRFDYTRAISPDVAVRDAEGRDTGELVRGLGTLYTFNPFSPRLGLTLKLSADGRTMLRASYGRFNQGVMTGELSPVHPGVSPVTTADFDPATGAYTRNVTVTDPTVSFRLDPDTRAPRTDAYSIGVDREIGRRLAASVAWVRKDGVNFVGWTDIGGRYHEETRPSPGGGLLPVWVLDNARTDRLYLLTNPSDYSMTYDGLVMSVERRRADGWQVSGAYTFARTSGLQAYSGTTAAGPQVSTVGAPPVIFGMGVRFGQDPNDLTNAGGRLPNDRPHMVRVMGALDVPKTGVMVAGNLQHYSGKPWAASAVVSLPQNSQQRILIEPRGTRRLQSQTLLDLRVSRPIRITGVLRMELLVDILNLLGDTAEEGVASDNRASSTFGQPNVFIDPRRAMLGVRVNLGR